MSCCVFTRGEFLIRPSVKGPEDCAAGVLGLLCNVEFPFLKVGNVESAVINIEGGVIGRENDFLTALADARQDISNVSIDLTISCVDKKNLELALLSKADDKQSGTMSDLFATCGKLSHESFFPFRFKEASNVSVFINHIDDIRPLDEGFDYILTPSGVQIINDSISIQEHEQIRIEYDYDNSNVSSFDFLNDIKDYKEIYFKGTNFGDDTETLFDARVYRVLFGPINSFDLITKGDFFKLSLSGSVERLDGRWFTIEKQG